MTVSIKQMIEQKKRFRRYEARKKQLPATYREALDAIQRYTYYNAPADGENLLRLLDDLIGLFEEAVANGTLLQDVVGDDPVEFAEGFIRNYSQPAWIAKQRERLTRSIKNVTEESGPMGGEGH
jgi:DNA-binding ferritin-like protein (Dps family)